MDLDAFNAAKDPQEAIREQLEALAVGAPREVQGYAQRFAGLNFEPGSKLPSDVMGLLGIDGDQADLVSLLEDRAKMPKDKLLVYSALAPKE